MYKILKIVQIILTVPAPYISKTRVSKTRTSMYSPTYVCSPRNHQYEASEGGLEEWYIPGSGPGIWVVQPVLATGGGGGKRGGSHPPPNTTGSNSTGPWVHRVPTRRLLVWTVSVGMASIRRIYLCLNTWAVNMCST
jgi:hypothetical protein